MQETTLSIHASWDDTTGTKGWTLQRSSPDGSSVRVEVEGGEKTVLRCPERAKHVVVDKSGRTVGPSAVVACVVDRSASAEKMVRETERWLDSTREGSVKPAAWMSDLRMVFLVGVFCGSVVLWLAESTVVSLWTAARRYAWRWSRRETVPRVDREKELLM